MTTKTRYTYRDENGDELEIEADSLKEAKEQAREHAANGSWGQDAHEFEGCRVGGSISWTDADDEEEREIDFPVDIAPEEPECSSPKGHRWTSEGEGGCSDNPGVWSVGGTTHVFASHCTRCGTRKKEVLHGSQRNPGEPDTTTYAPADDD